MKDKLTCHIFNGKLYLKYNVLFIFVEQLFYLIIIVTILNMFAIFIALLWMFSFFKSL